MEHTLMLHWASNDPKKTSVLLIDFNHAERLDSKAGLEYDQTPQTVCRILPLFISNSHL